MSGTRGRVAAAPEFAPRVLADAGQSDRAAAASIPAQQLDTIGERILRVAEQRNRREDQAAQEDAFDAGAAAGEAAPGSMMEGGGDIARRAFNRAALEAGGRRLEITARTEYERLARDHAADPAAFSAAAAAWRDGTLGTVPEAFRTRVAPQLDAMAQPFMRAIRDQSDRAVADERGATFAQALPLRLAAIERAGLRAATDPAARAEADREQAGLRSELIALGPRNAFTFEGQEYPADPTRAGRYTLEQMADIRRRSQDMEAVAVARSAFRTGPQTLLAVEEFERRAESGEIPGLRPDQARSVADALRRDVTQDRAARTEGQREADAALQPRIAADRAAIAEGGATVSNILDTELSAAGRNVAAYRAQERAMILGWQARKDLEAIDTPERAQEVADRFQPGTPLFAADPQTARQVLDYARQRGASIRASALDATILDRRAELAASSAAAVRHARAVPQEWQPHVAAGAQAANLPPFLLAALVGRESGGRADAVSPAGARGPAQIMPGTAASPGFGMPPISPADVLDPAKAIPWAAQYYRRLLDNFTGNHEHALMAYNWGAGNVQRWIAGGRTGPVPEETRRYVAALLPAAGGDPSRAGWQPPSIVSSEEGLQAGLTPEQISRVSAEAGEAARQAALRMRAQTATPDERAEIEAELAVVGERAAENARLASAWREALTQRAEAIQRDPAGYVTQASPVLQQLEQRVASGDMAALPALVDGIAQEQARQGVPEAQRRVLPQRMVTALFDSVAAAPTPEQGAERLRGLRQVLGAGPLVDVMRQAPITGGDQDTRRDSIMVAASRIDGDPNLSRQILRGMAVLQNNPPSNLPPTRVQADADAVLGQAFAASPAARDAAVAAARAVYAAELSAAGELGRSYDSTRFRAALSRVVPTSTWNGYRVPLPQGMDSSNFQRTMERLPDSAVQDAAAGGRRFTADMLQHGAAQLVAIGEGRFQVLYSGMSVMSASRPEQPFVLDLRGTAPRPMEPRQGRSQGLRQNIVRDAPPPEPMP